MVTCEVITTGLTSAAAAKLLGSITVERYHLLREVCMLPIATVTGVEWRWPVSVLVFRSGRISSVYIVGGWVGHTFSKLVNFECVEC